jgi:MoxR-like ATPase
MGINYFVGDYVNGVRDLYVASLVTGQHSICLGAPGWGKTDIPLSMLTEIHGQDFCFIRLNEANQPELIQGPPDIDHLLKHSQFRLNQVNTPYDPRFKALLLDEVGRTNDLIYSLLIDTLDRKGASMPVLATANFLPTGKKHEALLDRFGLWHWIAPSSMDAEAMAAAQMSRNETDPMLSVNGRLPTPSELLFIHAAKPGQAAIKAVSTFIGQLAAAAMTEGYTVNPRRIYQWQRIVYRMGVWMTGQEDFSTLPNEAIKAVRFAWPALTSADHSKWATLVTSIQDPVAAGIEVFLNEAASKVNEAAAITDPTQRMAYTTHVMAADANLTALGKTYPNDQRIADAKVMITSWFANIARGEKVSRS